MRKYFWLRAAAATTGAVLLSGVAVAAYADTQLDDNDVEVLVEIAEIDEPGVLALSVASPSVTLVENGSDELVRQFTGALPTVTVTDTRNAADIPDGAGWYVLGSSSGFTGSNGQSEIGAGNLGWAPRLIDGGGEGLVSEGDPVDTVLDEGSNNVGLVDQELLALAADSQAIVAEGQWTASADLFLRTPSTVAPGSYSATLTISLFE